MADSVVCERFRSAFSFGSTRQIMLALLIAIRGVTARTEVLPRCPAGLVALETFDLNGSAWVACEDLEANKSVPRRKTKSET